MTEGEKTVRASSAGLMWSLTCAVRKRATGTEPIKVEEDQEEEWEVEMMSAIVEGIRREEESVDVGSFYVVFPQSLSSSTAFVRSLTLS